MSVAMHTRHSERSVMLHAERRQFRYVVCSLLGNSPTSEFYKIQTPGNYPNKAYNIQNTAKVWNQENFGIFAC